MSLSNNPFAASANRKGHSRATAFAWVLALLMAAGAGVVAYLWSEDNARHRHDLQKIRAELGMTTTNLADTLRLLETMVKTNQEVAAALTNQIFELQKEKEQVGKQAKTLEDEMRQQLESKDVTISKLQGKLTVTIVDRVMFDSGEAILKPDGAAVMQKIADLLASHPELQIQVVGHTDNVPIRQTLHGRFASNWELSTARALAAVHFLTERAGVDPRRLGAAGYGEFRPIADNSTPEGRAKNRRITVTVLPEEFAVADALPIVHGPEATNGVPVTATAEPGS